MTNPRPSPRPAVAAPYNRGLSRVEAAAYIGVGATTFDRMILAGEMPNPKRIGTRKVWDLRALDLAFDALPGEDDAPKTNDWD